MNTRRSVLSREGGDDYPRNQADQINFAGEVYRRAPNETRLHRWRKLPAWLLLLVTIAFAMQACGYMSVLGAATTIVEDTRAKIQADYSPWPLLSFLPVDPAILDQINEDTGRIIAFQDSSSQAFWGTPSTLAADTNTEEPTFVLTPSGTSAVGDGSATATAESSPSVTATTTAPLTATATPPSSATPPSIATPTTSGNRNFNYTSTPQPPTPTAGGGHGTGEN